MFARLLAPYDILDPVGVEMDFGVHTGQSLDAAHQSVGGDANHLLEAGVRGMLDEDGAPGITVTSIRTGVLGTGTQLGSHIDLVLQPLAALMFVESLQGNL